MAQQGVTTFTHRPTAVNILGVRPNNSFENRRPMGAAQLSRSVAQKCGTVPALAERSLVEAAKERHHG
jgi:hypothetical protein